jgi:hypothetical protein
LHGERRSRGGGRPRRLLSERNYFSLRIEGTPYIEVTSNIEMASDAALELSKELSSLAAQLLSKPEIYVMA